MRVRGLKQKLLSEFEKLKMVAPHAGAWIETVMWQCGDGGAAVAPHAGAWIETSEKSAHCSGICVAPHAGALVEVQTAIQCWGVCIGVALAVGYETTADGAELHPPLLLCLPTF